MTTHFLDLQLEDALREGASHFIELYEDGGQRYLKFTTNSRSPGNVGAANTFIVKLSGEQARQLEDGMARLVNRLLP